MGLDSVRLMFSRDETWTHTETPGMMCENRDAEGIKGGGVGGREDGGAGGQEDGGAGGLGNSSARAGCVTTP